MKKNHSNQQKPNSSIKIEIEEMFYKFSKKMTWMKLKKYKWNYRQGNKKIQVKIF